MKANFETGLKVCSCCKQELPLSLFYKNKQTTDGYEMYCKTCSNEKRRERNKKPEIRERRRKRDQKYRQTDRYKEYIYNYNRSENYKKSSEKYRKSEKGKSKTKELCSKPEYIERARLYRQSQRGKEVDKRKHAKRRDNGKQAELLRRKRAENPNFKIQELLRGRLLYELKKKGIDKDNSALKLLGCSVDYLRDYLEKQFEPGMSWNNHGEWHIDHIVPCSYFDLTDPIQQRICFNFRNLQPLWAKDNYKKNNNLPEDYFSLIEEIRNELD